MKDVANICFPFSKLCKNYTGRKDYAFSQLRSLATVSKIDPKIQNLNQTVFIVPCLLMRTKNGFSKKKLCEMKLCKRLSNLIFTFSKLVKNLCHNFNNGMIFRKKSLLGDEAISKS